MIVGVMDSGIGGITTLAKLMNDVGGDYIFVRDSLGSYGDKSKDFIMRRTIYACNFLKSRGAEIIVIACNTATNVAIKMLRESDKGFTYIGVEPAVKPALKECKRVAVALTPAAARQEKFKRLILPYGDKIKLITLPSLAPEIENSGLREKELDRLADKLLYCSKGCDGLVLGCTHYVFLKERLSHTLKVFDGNEGVAKRLLSFTGKLAPPSVRFEVIGRES